MVVPFQRAFANKLQKDAAAMRKGFHENALGGPVWLFSWLLVGLIGLMPLAEASLRRAPSIETPAVIAFFVAVGSGVLLKRRFSWLSIVFHIYAQTTIWLSLFVMSLAFVFL